MSFQDIAAFFAIGLFTIAVSEWAPVIAALAH
ncbi:hypothetical protein M2311_003688 [Rhizobium leguminosarum]|nr:hypothetical protein [Rhizobium leguminosarum]